MNAEAIRVIRICSVLLALGLSACGGGGSSTCNSGIATLCDNLGVSSAAPGVTTPAAGQGSLQLSLVDAAGASTTSVSPTQAGTLRAQLKDSKGATVPNVAVTFTTTDKTGAFVPSSGTALSDSSGLAQVGLPAGAQAGAFTATASATVGGNAATSSTSYSVTFPTLTFSALTITPASLSAGGTASLGVTVLSGTSAFTPAQSVIFTSPCAVAGKATISSPVVTVNGVANTSYADKGCGGSDTITASTSLGGATFSQAGAVTVLPATGGQIAFVSALPQNIALKGTGGPGRQESSTVAFKVLDKNGNPAAGQLVDFALTTSVGGLTRNPVSSTTGADGMVSTVVAAGTINTPVRVTATLTGTTISTLSDQLVVSTGVPDQNSFSLSTATYNVEGMNHDGCDAPVGSTVRVSLADHFNNPAPDGTAVSFTTKGGTVDASCLTGLVNTTLTNGTVITQKGIPGQCSVRFCAANPRPDNGRITILAYALGEESFIDTNGNNLYDSATGRCDVLDTSSEKCQDLGEPFRNDRAITNLNANANWGVNAYTLAAINPDGDGWSTGNAARVAGEAYIDTNADSTWNAVGDGVYNGVLKSTQNFDSQGTHVRAALVQVLSTSSANITALDAVPVALSHCVDGTPFVNVPRTLRIAVRDFNPTIYTNSIFASNTLPGNILPAGTAIKFSTSNGAILSATDFIVPNTNDPSQDAWTYYVSIQSDATQTGPGGSIGTNYVCGNPVTGGLLTVKVTTPLGIVTTQTFSIID